MKIKELLIYFVFVRKIKNRAIAQRVKYGENYLTNVRKGNVIGSEKLLRALEDFFELDNLNQVREKKRQIEDLNREIVVLSQATIEKFYAERQAQVGSAGLRPGVEPGLNDRPSPGGPDAVNSADPAVHVKFGVQRGAGSATKQKPSQTKKGGKK